MHWGRNLVGEITLKVVSLPNALNEVKQSSVQVLKDVLELAEKGEINNVLIITDNTDGSWSHVYSEALNACEVIGRMEVLKHEWIEDMANG